MQAQTSTTSTESSLAVHVCDHCGSDVPRARADSRFCCAGCEAVYGLLQSRDLGDRFYELKHKKNFVRPALPAPVAADSYSYLDDSETRSTYLDSDSRCIQFYLEGVHCVACVWLTEKLPEFVPGVSGARLDLGSSVATVHLENPAAASAAAREFARLGYRPHPVKVTELDAHKERENRLFLIRMAVAGFCAGNIMLLAVSLYGGAEGGLRDLFRWASFALSLPVLAFSAVPFYQGALTAIRARQSSIDLPIAIGTLLAAAASTANLIRGSEHIYFDSMTTLVFLLLAVRYVLRRAQQFAFLSTRLIHFLIPTTVRVQTAQGLQELPLERVQVGERVEVRSQEPIPVDGIVAQGRSQIDASLLTGESRPETRGPGEIVFAGTVNLGSTLQIEVTRSGAATRLGSILESVETSLNSQAPIVAYADRISRGFVWAVMAASFLMLGFGIFGNWEEALGRSLALAIVACPCAFALATPLAMSATLGRAARKGILIKSADALERLARARTVFLDKTGTLTHGSFEVLGWTTDTSTPEALEVAVALERPSNHPIARALVARLGEREAPRTLEIEDWKETLGQGVSGTYQGHRYELKADPTTQLGTAVALFKDSKPVASFRLGDSLRPDSPEAISRLQALGLSPWILSGDSSGPVQAVAAQVGIPAVRALCSASPEQKKTVVERIPGAVMVGDGANDAIALASASVGVAVHSGLEISMKAADIYQSQAGLMPLVDLIEASRETMKVVRRSLAFSLVYNAIGVVAAFIGWVDPLFAAVLMPLSSLTVIAIAMTGTRRLRELFA
jgi:heavy metal translocating P-type ATPase